MYQMFGRHELAPGRGDGHEVRKGGPAHLALAFRGEGRLGNTTM